MHYDEMAYLRENAEEAGLPWAGQPSVRRQDVEVDGRRVSALVWGDGPPEVVLLHGGGQNAHTWDTVALALDRPLVAVDLPGHGHSGWRDDLRLGPVDNAETLAPAIERLAPGAPLLVGMSLGGLTAIALQARAPQLARALAVVDVLPTADHTRAGAIAAFLAGPETFESFDAILERTIAFNPTRSESSLRRGILHNAEEQPDGTWRWRYQRLADPEVAGRLGDFSALWDDLERIGVPTMLVRGADSPVVTDGDVEELLRRRPATRVEVVEGAGHSVQGDRPVELASLLDDFDRARLET